MIKILSFNEMDKNDLFIRDIAVTQVGDRVSEIIAQVREKGDFALIDYAKRFDRADITEVEVTEKEIEDAFSKVSPKLIEVIKKAAKNIEAFHRNQVRSGFITSSDSGAVCGQLVLPIEKVGLYVPGGTAAYPSSVLMNCIPAKLAGCKLIAMTTPPSADGSINPAILVAAKIAGVDRIFKSGGAQAIAALCYGTQTVPAVDKIVGPGNAYVAEAKRQVFGKVAIDMIAGPSEILVVADSKSDPRFVAADLLSQAEHDRMASAVLVTDSSDFAKAVQAELEVQIPLLARADIARESIDKNGKIIVADDINQAIDVANELAPEHLEICTDSPFDLLSRVKNAGSVFLGRYCPEALGDYLAGPNHTLPTSGTARFSSPLSVDDFVKKTQYTYFTKSALEEVYLDVDTFAKAEGLTAHAKSATIRFEVE